MTITPENYRLYFENIATKNKAILFDAMQNKQFVCVDMDEIEDSVFKLLDTKKWCMVLEDMTGHFGGANDENLAIVPSGAFLVFKYCKVGDRAAERTILNDAFEIGKQILAKMYKDMYEFNAATNANIMVNFEPKSVQFDTLKAIHDNCFGYRFQFEFSNHVILEYDASKWN